ncbi:MAG: hypothetical protein WCQ64_05170 [Acidobacteriota bacterium]
MLTIVLLLVAALGMFGHVLSGLDVVRKIQQQPVDGQNLAAPVTIRAAWRVGSAK